MTVDRARLLGALDDLGVQGLAGVGLADVPEVDVAEPVYLLTLDAAVDTNVATLELGLEATTYQPDAFPGVVYQGDAATVLVFGTGQLVVVDTDSRETAEAAVATVVARLVDTDLVDAAAVPDAGVEPVELPPEASLPDELVAALEADTDATDDGTCPSCGETLDGTENFCPVCGTEVRA